MVELRVPVDENGQANAKIRTRYPTSDPTGSAGKFELNMGKLSYIDHCTTSNWNVYQNRVLTETTLSTTTVDSNEYIVPWYHRTGVGLTVHKHSIPLSGEYNISLVLYNTIGWGYMCFGLSTLNNILYGDDSSNGLNQTIFYENEGGSPSRIACKSNGNVEYTNCSAVGTGSDVSIVYHVVDGVVDTLSIGGTSISIPSITFEDKIYFGVDRWSKGIVGVRNFQVIQNL